MRNGRQNRGREHGFTSMELVVAMIVAMILSLVAVAGYTVYQRESPVKYAAQRLNQGLAAARAFAVANNTSCILRIDPRYQNFWIDEVDPLDLTKVVTPKVVAPEALGERATLAAASLAGGAVTLDTTPPYQNTILIPFDANGTTPNDAMFWLRMGDAGSTLYYGVKVYGPTGMSRVLSDVGAPTTTLMLALPVK